MIDLVLEHSEVATVHKLVVHCEIISNQDCKSRYRYF